MPCQHGRRRSRCKECGGSGLCEHGRVRSKCKECGGSGICEHGRVRSKCKECGGGAKGDGLQQGVKRRKMQALIPVVKESDVVIIDGMSITAAANPPPPLRYEE